jgi:hypothetical protein
LPIPTDIMDEVADEVADDKSAALLYYPAEDGGAT